MTLFTRPRRFGKTLALTMLRIFFEAEMDRKGERKDNSHYFDGTKIMAAGEEYTRHMGQYPVIFLSLKSAKQPTFEMAYLSLVDAIKLRMYEMGLNQAKLSELLGVSPSRVSDYLTGRSEPTLKVARDISRKLNIDASIVLGV